MPGMPESRLQNVTLKNITSDVKEAQDYAKRSKPVGGRRTIYLLPVNLYGRGDNFDPATSHVISALVRKFSEAQQRGAWHPVSSPYCRDRPIFGNSRNMRALSGFGGLPLCAGLQI